MKKASLYLLLLLSISTSAWSAEKVVRISTLYDYPPFCFKEEHAEGVVNEIVEPGSDAQALKGYSWDVVRESFHAMGYTIELKIVPWSRGMLYLNMGKVDLIFPAAKTAERLEKYHFSEFPTDRQQFVIYIQKNSTLKWSGLESLRGMHIGTMIDWSFGQRFDNAHYIEKEPSTKIILGLRKLAAGRLDGVVGYEIAYDYEIKKEGISHKFKKLPPFDHTDEFIIGPQKYPRVTQLLNAFDQGHQKMVQTGLFDKIEKRWLTH